MIGKLLNDRYEICKQLSKKAGRRTFLAQDLKTQNEVIIKILLFDQDFAWDELKLFEREAKTLQNLDHPAIPKYLDYFEVNDGTYHGFALVQTYIDAPSLDMHIQQGRKFSEAELIQLAEQVLDVLNYLHTQMPVVIHRDIKPSNILLANRSSHSIGEIYLVDFGSVQTAASQEGGTITIVGSYGYIPLEQFGGQAVPASDLYSLGMTVVYLATGIHPAEIPQVDGQSKYSAPQLSKQFQRWLDRMIQPHLNKRFDSTQLAQKALKFPDNHFGNYSELRPKGTKVKLHRHLEQLEIILPTNTLKVTGMDLEGFLFKSFIFFLLCFSCLAIIIALGWLIHFLYFCSFIYLIIIVKLFSGKTNGLEIERIIISNKQIIGYRQFEIETNQTPILTNLRSDISVLGYSPSYEFDNFWDSTGKELNRGKVITKAELFIYAGSNKYSITNLSAIELWWLGQELSEFLNLELQIIYPNPKILPPYYNISES